MKIQCFLVKLPQALCRISIFEWTCMKTRENHTFVRKWLKTHWKSMKIHENRWKSIPHPDPAQRSAERAGAASRYIWRARLGFIRWRRTPYYQPTLLWTSLTVQNTRPWLLLSPGSLAKAAPPAQAARELSASSWWELTPSGALWGHLHGLAGGGVVHLSICISITTVYISLSMYMYIYISLYIYNYFKKVCISLSIYIYFWYTLTIFFIYSK